jgi:peptidyl-prolyl cis-trans isomerase C
MRSAGAIFREPLAQFLLIALALFAINRFVDADQGGAEPSQRVELTVNDLRQMTVMWLAQGRPVPNEQQLRAMIDQRVNLEILSREAVALGLDKNDEIIRRRLAQKMEFLFEDLGELEVPTAAELKAWVEKNSDRFKLPPRISFHHLYFSLDKHGGTARQAAETALVKIGSVPARLHSAGAIAIAADPFMFQDNYVDRTPESVAKDFGPAFAKAIFSLRPGIWAGPIESGYGWHLVFVDAIVPEHMPAFTEIEPQVKADWLEARIRELKDKALKEIRSRYTVILPVLDTETMKKVLSTPQPNPVQGEP